jgi:hypothetical protein
VQGWRQQFDKLESVDLRYEHQIIVNPDTQGMAKAPKITPAAAKAAMAAGVKTAALIHVVTVKKPSVPDSATVKLDKPQWEKASFNPPAKQAPKKAAHRRARPKARAKKASPKAASKPVTTDGAAKPAAKAVAASKPAAGAARSTPPASKKKPSAAVAKNHDPQDHP